MTAPVLIPQVWVQEARASALTGITQLLHGIRDDATLPANTRRTATTAALLTEAIVRQLGEHITRAALAEAGITIRPPVAVVTGA